METQRAITVNRWDDSGKPTWGALAAAEPRLMPLLMEALAHHTSAGSDFCGNEAFYGGEVSLKERLSRLVGWGRKGHALLGTTDAYDVAYETIYDALPDCRHEGMC